MPTKKFSNGEYGPYDTISFLRSMEDLVVEKTSASLGVQMIRMGFTHAHSDHYSGEGSEYLEKDQINQYRVRFRQDELDPKTLAHCHDLYTRAYAVASMIYEHQTTKRMFSSLNQLFKAIGAA